LGLNLVLMKRLLAKVISFSMILECGCCALVAQVQNAEQSGHQGMLDRIMHPNREAKSSYQGKSFNVMGGSYEKVFATKEYSGSKEFGARSYATKGFGYEIKNWFGDHLFPRKHLSDNLSKVSPDSAKKFDTLDFKTKSFSQLDKKSPYDLQSPYATKEIIMKGKTQGAIDNNSKLQEAVRKGLSVDDVRKLLNKAP
jgi:hypothetical protein